MNTTNVPQMVSKQASEVNNSLNSSSLMSERYLRMQKFLLRRNNSSNLSPQRRKREEIEVRQKEAISIRNYHKSPFFILMSKVERRQKAQMGRVSSQKSKIDHNHSERELQMMARQSNRSLERMKTQRVPINASQNLIVGMNRSFRAMIAENLFHNGMQALNSLDPERQRQSSAFYNHLQVLRKGEQKSTANSIHKTQELSQSARPQKHSSLEKLTPLIQESARITQDFKRSASELQKVIHNLEQIRPTDTFEQTDARQNVEMLEMINQEPRTVYNFKIMKALTVNDKDIRSSRKRLYQIEKFREVVLPQKVLR